MEQVKKWKKRNPIELNNNKKAEPNKGRLEIGFYDFAFNHEISFNEFECEIYITDLKNKRKQFNQLQIALSYWLEIDSRKCIFL